jgi:hypothetical protein
MVKLEYKKLKDICPSWSGANHFNQLRSPPPVILPTNFTIFSTSSVFPNSNNIKQISFDL